MRNRIPSLLGSPIHDLLSVCFVLGLTPSTATAQDCPEPNIDYATTLETRAYKIYEPGLFTLHQDGPPGEFSHEPLDGVQVQRAIIAGADVWAEQTNSRAFRYEGPYASQIANTPNDIPETLSECLAQGIDFSLVSVMEEQLWGCAAVYPRCKEEIDSDGDGDVDEVKAHQFTLFMSDRKDGSTKCLHDATAYPSRREFDLQALMSHEFGHTLDQGHASISASMMDALRPGPTQRRAAYQRDVECVSQRSGQRQGTGFVRAIEGGTVTSQLPYTSFLPVGNSVVGLTQLENSTNGVFSSVSKHPFCPFWMENGASGSIQCLDLPSHSLLSVFTLGAWRETPGLDRLFYSTVEDHPSDYGGHVSPMNSVHRVRMRTSSDGFQTAQDSWLTECVNAPGCSVTRHVQSAFPVAVGWDDFTSNSLTVWNHQDRSDASQDGIVRLAVGQLSEGLLPQSLTIADLRSEAAAGAQVTSAVAPAIACKAYQANGHDCLLAVVPLDDPLHRITLYRFWLNLSSSSPIIMDNQVTVLDAPDGSRSTGSRLAAFYHEGKFFLAFRSMAPWQPVEVLSSPDTLGWSLEAQVESDSGPTAASYVTGNNVLGVTH